MSEKEPRWYHSDASSWGSARVCVSLARSDGTQIAFHSDRADGGFELYVMNADGSSVTRITNSPGVDGGASWGP